MKTPINGRNCRIQIALLLGFSFSFVIIYFNYLHSSPSLVPQTRHQPTAPGESKVYRWTGKGWEMLVNACTLSDFPHCSTLKTPNGDTPIFHHDPKHDYTSSILVQYGRKEPQTIESILKYLAQDYSIAFLDVGSHVGSIALQMAKAGYTIVTVDPLPENIGRLCKSVQIGGFVDRVTILFSPVSNDHKTVEFKRNWNVGETKVKQVSEEDQTQKTQTAAPSCRLSPLLSRTATLDDIMPFIKSHKVFVKIDVESHEYFVVKGGVEFFKQKQVVGIFMEWIHVKKTPEAKTLISLLNSYGFAPYMLENMSVKLGNDNYMNWPIDIIWKRI